MKPTAMLESCLHALRAVTRGRAFASFIILILGLGIGATSAVFAFIEGLSRPLPFPDPGRLVMIWEGQREKGNDKLHVAPPNLTDWRQGRSFTGLAALYEASFTLTGEGQAERVVAASVSSNFFQTLGVGVEAGRDFTPLDEKGPQAYVVLLSHELWQTRYGGSPDLIGRSIRVDGLPRTVIGIVPSGREFPRGTKLWLPLVYCDCDQSRDKHYLSVVGRIKPGVTPAAAQAELDTISERLAAEFPKTNSGWYARMVPLSEEILGDTRPALRVLAVAVALLMLIACASVANLLLARGLLRAPEIAVRQALGASRGRVGLQLFAESLLLALIGSAVGLALSWGLLRLTLPLVPADLAEIREIGLNPRVLSFALAVGVLTSLLFGLLPAFQGSRSNLAETLKQRGRGATTGGLLLRNGIVVAEFSLAFALLVNAILLLWSFTRLLLVDPGFQPHGLLTVRVGLDSGQYEKPEEQALFFSELKRRIGTLPGVERVALTDALPITGSTEGTWFLPEGRPRPKPGEEPATRVTMVSEGYFRTLGIPLLSGRDFDEHDDAGQPIRVIVNEMMARKYWPGGSPVGRRIKMGDLNSDVWYEIVGVVGDVRTEGLDAPVPPRVYASFRQAPDTRMSLVLATSRPLDPVVDGVRRELAAMDPDVPAYGIRTVDEILEQSLGRNRLVVLVVGSFTLMALVLSVLGLYGVMAANVASRTRELGVRVALGSTGRGLAWLVLRRALILALAGAIAGGAIALALGRVLSSLLFEVQSGDPGIFALATLLLFAMALLGSASAARRAVAIDPITALQSE